MRRFTFPSGLLLALALICLAVPAVYGGDRIGGENAAVQLQGQNPAVAPEVIKSNTGSTVPPKPFSRRWEPIRLMAGVPNVLVYTDDAYHTAPNTPADQALQWLGFPYTAHYNGDFTGFISDLNTGAWDLVIFASDNYGTPSDIFDELYTYASGGGRLILHGWTLSGYPAHPLWAFMGVQISNPYYDPVPGVYWLEPGHSVFNDPMSVPELLYPIGGRYGTYGFRCSPLPGFAPVAAWNVPDKADADVALVLGPTTIFKGFLDGQYDQDEDDDGMLDITELWINMISGIMEGFSAYDLIYVDDLGRAKLCVNSQTGDFSYKVLKGTGIGEYTGQAYLSMRNGVLFINSTTLTPRLQFYDNQKFHKAYGSFTKGAIRSYLDDKNTANDPTSCN